MTGHCAGNAATGAAASSDTRSDLYKAPVPFQGRSLEGVPSGGDPTELARLLDAEIPVEDLLPGEPCPDDLGTNAVVVSNPVIDEEDDDKELAERQVAYVKHAATRPARTRDPVSDGVGSGAEAPARLVADDRWAACALAVRSAPCSFSDDSHRFPTLVEHGSTSCPDQGERAADSYRGLDRPDPLDRTLTAHDHPEPGNGTPGGEAGFGGDGNGWSEFPFSCRERILHTLSKGETLDLSRADVLASGVEGRGAACCRLRSTQYGAMVNMMTELEGGCRHARRHALGARDGRVRQLVEMLDLAVVVA